MTTLAELRLQNDRVEQAIEHVTDILLLIRTERQLERQKLLWEIYQQARLQMNTESARLNDLINQLQVGYKERREMKRVTLFASVLMLLLLAFGSGFAVAQDVPPEATVAIIEGQATLLASTAIPEVAVTEAVEILPTEEAPVVIINNPPPASDSTDRTFYVVGFIGMLLIFGIREAISTRQVGALLRTINRAMDNTQVIDEARQRYSEASLSTQEFIKLFQGVFTFLGSVNIPGIDPTLDKTSEFLGNVTKPEAPGSPIPNIPDSDPFARQYPGDGQPSTFS